LEFPPFLAIISVLFPENIIKNLLYAIRNIFSSLKTFKIYCKMPILFQTDVVSKETKKAYERRIYTQNNQINCTLTLQHGGGCDAHNQIRPRRAIL